MNCLNKMISLSTNNESSENSAKGARMWLLCEKTSYVIISSAFLIEVQGNKQWCASNTFNVFSKAWRWA